MTTVIMALAHAFRTNPEFDPEAAYIGAVLVDIFFWLAMGQIFG